MERESRNPSGYDGALRDPAIGRSMVEVSLEPGPPLVGQRMRLWRAMQENMTETVSPASDDVGYKSSSSSSPSFKRMQGTKRIRIGKRYLHVGKKQTDWGCGYIPLVSDVRGKNPSQLRLPFPLQFVPFNIEPECSQWETGQSSVIAKTSHALHLHASYLYLRDHILDSAFK